MAVGGAIEVLQEVLTENRHAEVGDLITEALGVSAALGTACVGPPLMGAALQVVVSKGKGPGSRRTLARQRPLIRAPATLG